MSGTERQTVTIVGPTRYRFRLTDEELEVLSQSDHPLPEGVEPVEWEPVRSDGEWSVDTGSEQ